LRPHSARSRSATWKSGVDWRVGAALIAPSFLY
jgi:hypothetical protein